jgi:TetR/AcrR family transcriptional regulator, transcriptional repressor for nem operon
MSANQKSEPRSLTARGAATRARIVEAAADLIYAHGVERTSLDDVMAASGVSKSQLYHYFADKDALVLEVIARQTERVLDAQRPHLEALDSLSALKAWRDAIVRLNKAAQGKGCPLGSLASELANDSEPARKRLADSFSMWRDRIERGHAANLPPPPIRTIWLSPSSARSRAGFFWPRRPIQVARWKSPSIWPSTM